MAKKDTNLNVNVTGDTADLEAALKKSSRDLGEYERSINSAKRALDQLERESLKASVIASKAERDMAKAADEHAAAQQRAWDKTKQSGSALGSLAAAAALVTPQVAAAGVAMGAFGALAVPSIAKVVMAQSDMANQWDTLDKRQKIAAVGVEGLVDEYKRLSKSMEPETMAAFNSALAVARGILPTLVPLAHQGSVAFNGLITDIGGMLGDQAFGGLFQMIEQRAVPDMNLLSTVVTNTGDAGASLITDLEPLGQTLLQGAGGVTKLVSELAQASPTTVQLGVSMYALYKPASALVGAVGPLGSKLTTAAKAAGIFGGEAKLAGAGAGLLKSASGALPGILTGAVVVLGALALKMSSVKTQAELVTENVIAQKQAVGNNVSGYQGAITYLTQYQQHLQATNRQLNTGEQSLGRNDYAIAQVNTALGQLRTKQKNVQIGSQQLGAQYNISANQAITLANAAGVDLSTAMDKNGKMSAQATAKIAQYRAGVQLANNPTRAIGLSLQTMANGSLDADTRLKALTSSLNAYFAPSIAAFGDTTDLRNAQEQLATALKKAHGQIGLETTAQRNARAAFAAYISQTVKAAQDQYTLDSKTMGAKAATDKYRNSIIASLPKLYTYAGRNKSARQQVDALALSTGGISRGELPALRAAATHAATSLKNAGDRATYMRKMINLIKTHLNVTIDVKANGSFTFTNNTANPFTGSSGSNVANRGKASGHYAGGGRTGLVSGPGGARSDMAGTYDLSNGEFVVNAPATRRYLPQLVAMNDEGNRGTPYRTQGLAGGGLSGFNTAVSGTQRGLNWETNQAAQETAKRAAAAMKKMLTSFPGGSGSSRWAPLVMQVLAMLGMPTSLVGGVLALIARESGGNPSAINLWDSNAKAGHPSQGLMQTIPGTFNAYAGPYRGLGITNPLANIYAGLNYIRHRYPSLAPIRPGWVGGYDEGGRWPSGTLGINTTGHDERVLTPRQNDAFERLVARLPVTRIGMNEALRPAAADAAPVTVNVNHVPGYSTESDVQNAMANVHRRQRLART